MLSQKMLRACKSDNSFSYHSNPKEYGQLHINCYTTTTISQKPVDDHHVIVSIKWFQRSCHVSEGILLIHI